MAVTQIYASSISKQHFFFFFLSAIYHAIMHGNRSGLRTRIDRLRWSRYCENNDLATIADDVLCEMIVVMVKVRRRRLLVTFVT